MSGAHPVFSADIGGLSLLIVAHTAPRPGEAWDPEDGPRPRNGVSASLVQEETHPTCACRGHETCYACDLTREIELAHVWRSGPPRVAWRRLLHALRADPRFFDVFACGAALAPTFHGDELRRVRRLSRRARRHSVLNPPRLPALGGR